MQELINQGAAIDEDINEWEISPLELATQCGLLISVDSLLSKGLPISSNKSLKFAIEKGKKQ